jgi:hypothetical protein
MKLDGFSTHKTQILVTNTPVTTLNIGQYGPCRTGHLVFNGQPIIFYQTDSCHTAFL